MRVMTNPRSASRAVHLSSVQLLFPLQRLPRFCRRVQDGSLRCSAVFGGDGHGCERGGNLAFPNALVGAHAHALGGSRSCSVTRRQDDEGVHARSESWSLRGEETLDAVLESRVASRGLELRVVTAVVSCTRLRDGLRDHRPLAKSKSAGNVAPTARSVAKEQTRGVNRAN